MSLLGTSSVRLAPSQYKILVSFLPVIEGNDKVEEVGLPQVGWRLLLEVGSPDSRAVEDQCDHLGADCDTCWFLC